MLSRSQLNDVTSKIVVDDGGSIYYYYETKERI